MGSRNSFSKISPGVMRGRKALSVRGVLRPVAPLLFVVIVDDFDIACVSVTPAKTNPPLAIYSNTPLPVPAALQLFKPIGRRNTQIL
jgi:hypothetical protein